ncbi:UvrD-helicase domain-containing protein [Salipaludibacillus sp. CF4.18]|uniref:UvrD-helicase domain-containing protein n=1 Tax=Salipaludibacillus sp. CF4.18 TaxID=3373081 RepID=UPI003EE500D2
MIETNITAVDIEVAEKILLEDGKKFDADEKVPIISCMGESIDVIACPGSGKTTILLAKLCILSEKMPFIDEKGIVVLTHTNVAIKEIIDKLGYKSDILFNYPNFFGTIHSFINKYLALPYYKETFRINRVMINDDIFNYQLIRKITPWGKLDKYIFGQVIRQFEKKPPSQVLRQLKTDFLCSIYMDLEGDRIVFKKSGRIIVKNPEKGLYKELFELFYENLVAQGYLRYRDTYLLAQLCINKHPSIKSFFAKRFKYLFVDETQDNSFIQNEIFNYLFASSETIIQRFGDPNQAIYESIHIDQPQNFIELKNYEISKSMRYSQSIANFINPLRIEKGGQNLLGKNDCEDDIPPHIIIYDKSRILEVKEQFIELIQKFKLSDDKHPFKAVGWVSYHDNPDRTTIQSYFPGFLSYRKVAYQLDRYNFHICLNKNIKRKQTVGNVYKSILEFCVNYLKYVGIEFEESYWRSFEKTLEEEKNEYYQKLRKQTYLWSKAIFSNDQKVYDDIKEYLKEVLELFIKNENFDENHFNSLFYLPEGLVEQNNNNRYSKVGTTVIVDTIHGVKGETHKATLYLETFYKVNDIKRILKFILNRTKKQPNIDEFKSLKMTYVGMSRAKELLCIAIENESIGKMEMEVLKTKEKHGEVVIVGLNK